MSHSVANSLLKKLWACRKTDNSMNKELCLVQCMHRDKVWKSSFMFLVIVFSLHYINTMPRVTGKIAKTHLKNMYIPNSNMSFPVDVFAFRSILAILVTKVFIVLAELRAFILGSDQSKQFLDLRGDLILFAWLNNVYHTIDIV